MIELPNKKKCYNLPEQVAQNLLNIQYLAEQYKNIDELPSIWADYKTAFDADLHTFEDWTTTFEGWENTLATYLANMSSAAVGAINGQNITPAAVSATGPITAPSIVETMTGYSFSKASDPASYTKEWVYIGAVKNGNKLTLVIAFNLTMHEAVNDVSLGTFSVPLAVYNMLFPTTISGTDYLDLRKINIVASTFVNADVIAAIQKGGNILGCNITGASTLTLETKYYVRHEVTFLLSDNLAA